MPNKNQHHVVNHLQAQEALEANRNVLEESARIARGEIEDIANLEVEKFDALVIPVGVASLKIFAPLLLREVQDLLIGLWHQQ